MKRKLIALLLVVALVLSLGLVTAAPVGATPGSIVGLWHLDEGSGQVAADATGVNDGYLGSSMVADANDPDWVSPGMFGKALSFNGSTDYVSVPDSASLDIGTSDFTIEAWIKLATTADDYYGIYDKGKGKSAGEGRYSLFVTPSDTLRLHVYGQSGGEGAYYDSTLTIDDTSWHYVAVSCDRDGNAIFAIDGSTETVDISGSGSHDVSSTYDAAIGVRQWDKGDHWFDGYIDEVRVWDYALTAGEIAQSYALGTNATGVTELSHQNLSDGGTAIFTSAFYIGRDEPSCKTVNARAMVVGSSATVSDLTERKVTPRGSVGYNPTAVTDGYDIHITGKSGGAKSLHLTMWLTSGDGLGVNVQFLPYD